MALVFNPNNMEPEKIVEAEVVAEAPVAEVVPEAPVTPVEVEAPAEEVKPAE